MQISLFLNQLRKYIGLNSKFPAAIAGWCLSVLGTGAPHCKVADEVAMVNMSKISLNGFPGNLGIFVKPALYALWNIFSWKPYICGYETNFWSSSKEGSNWSLVFWQILQKHAISHIEIREKMLKTPNKLMH